MASPKLNNQSFRPMLGKHFKPLLCEPETNCCKGQVPINCNFPIEGFVKLDFVFGSSPVPIPIPTTITLPIQPSNTNPRCTTEWVEHYWGPNFSDGYFGYGGCYSASVTMACVQTTSGAVLGFYVALNKVQVNPFNAPHPLACTTEPQWVTIGGGYYIWDNLASDPSQIARWTAYNQRVEIRELSPEQFSGRVQPCSGLSFVFGGPLQTYWKHLTTIFATLLPP
jgi:hypothetical protein